ncbi:MAG: tetrahydrodipicolinate succinyltransferase [Gammaproteobacteria bacterium]|nr:tetrahydrodipicolinate succinyltransferase [Gammaproteobacteria bacterium]
MIRTGHRYRDSETGITLDTWFPRSNQRDHRSCLAEQVGLIKSDFVEVSIDNFDSTPTSTEDTYLRLHLLSECTVRPNEINLEGIFDLLPIVAWTSAGPVLPNRVDQLRHHIASEHHHLSIQSIDKFPRMVDYVIPPEVRIGDADRVRLGAHLWPGTTVMHEGFVNFNAGSIGAAMIEGRVTPGVIVGEGSDVGAGSSIMGTLSGGGKQTNSIGERSLLGANGGIGISLGDDCIVEAGLYVTAGTKVTTPDGNIVHARNLSGQSGLLFRRNSISGCVEVVSAAGTDWGGLNITLHKNG